MLSPAVLTAFGIPLFAPPAALSLRVGIRNRYGVKVICIHRNVKGDIFCLQLNMMNLPALVPAGPMASPILVRMTTNRLDLAGVFLLAKGFLPFHVA